LSYRDGNNLTKRGLAVLVIASIAVGVSDSGATIVSVVSVVGIGVFRAAWTLVVAVAEVDVFDCWLWGNGGLGSASTRGGKASVLVVTGAFGGGGVTTGFSG